MAIFLPGNKTERVGELVRPELLELALIDCISWMKLAMLSQCLISVDTTAYVFAHKVRSTWRQTNTKNATYNGKRCIYSSPDLKSGDVLFYIMTTLLLNSQSV